MSMGNLEDDVKKLLGMPPYDSPQNFCWNDNYYAKSLNDQYGEIAVNQMIQQLHHPETEAPRRKLRLRRRAS